MPALTVPAHALSLRPEAPSATLPRMALKPCQGCGKEVDTTAKTCPGCGRPNPAVSDAAKINRIASGVLVAALAFGGFVFFGRSGCGKDEAPAVAVQTERAAAVASTLPVAAPDRARSTLSTSIAVFQGDQLFECIDIEMGFPTPDGGVDMKKEGEALVGIVNALSMQKKASGTKLTGVCGEQFKDRHPFGVCLWDQRADETTFFKARRASFAFDDVFLSDAGMKNCIGSRGRWSAVSRDSDEYTQAKLQHDLGGLQRELAKARRGIDQ